MALPREKDKIFLRNTGLKATPPRLQVLRVLAAAKGPINAQAIVDALKRDVDQATIYRIIKSFIAKGVIRQIDLRHNHAHYELRRDDEHHHLVCIRCGRLEDVKNCDIEDTYARVLRQSKNFSSIKEHALEFYGVCKLCAKK